MEHVSLVQIQRRDDVDLGRPIKVSKIIPSNQTNGFSQDMSRFNVPKDRISFMKSMRHAVS